MIAEMPDGRDDATRWSQHKLVTDLSLMDLSVTLRYTLYASKMNKYNFIIIILVDFS